MEGIFELEIKGSVHPPMADTRNQIRLLKLIEDSGTAVTYDLTVVNFKRGIERLFFFAISYTWGEHHNSHKITINGKAFWVGQNCFEALRRARLHYPWASLWIDAICINQTDLAEKSGQVAIMRDIYKEAALVLLCVEQHFADSELVATWAKRTEALLPNRKSRDPDLEAWKSVAWSTYRELNTAEECCRAFENFATRRYWKRLWVAQEIAHSDIKEVLCGDDIIPWELMELLNDVYSAETIQKSLEDFRDLQLLRDIHPFDTYAQRACMQDLPLGLLLKQFYYHECEDRRDRIYALLGLARERDREELTPDYSISEFALALRVAKMIPMENLNTLISTLGLSSRSDEVRRFIEQRGKQCEMSTSDAYHSSNTVKIWYRLEEPAQCLDGVWTDQNGQFRADFQRVEGWSPRHVFWNQSCFSANSFDDGWQAAVQKYPALSSAQYIMHGEHIAALVCKEVQPGDLLAKVHDPIFLVLRRDHDQVYDIIGRGFVLGEFDFSTKDMSSSMPVSRVDVNLSAEDAVALMATEVPATHKGISFADRIESISSLVTTCPSGAARVIFASSSSRPPDQAG